MLICLPKWALLDSSHVKMNEHSFIRTAWKHNTVPLQRNRVNMERNRTLCWTRKRYSYCVNVRYILRGCSVLTYRPTSRRSVQTSSWRQTVTSRGYRWSSLEVRAPSTSSTSLSTSRTVRCCFRRGLTTASRWTSSRSERTETLPTTSRTQSGRWWNCTLVEMLSTIRVALNRIPTSPTSYRWEVSTF